MINTADIVALVEACLETNLTHIEIVSEVRMETGEDLKTALGYTNRCLLGLYWAGKLLDNVAYKSPLFTEYMFRSEI